jgi:peptidyl-prolyl cis-trans isomerase D
MLNTFRKRQRTLLIIITAVVIVAFAWWYNPGKTHSFGQQNLVGKINGRGVTLEELQKVYREIQIAAQLAQFGQLDWQNFVYSLGGRDAGQNAAEARAWNLLVIRDAAKRLLVEPNEKLIAATEKALPILQRDGKFDPAAYQQIISLFGSQGLSAADFDQLVGDTIRVRNISELVATAPVPSQLVLDLYERLNEKLHLGLIRFPEKDFSKDVQVSDNEIKTYYDAHKAGLLSPEKRKVEFVLFSLTDEQKKLDEAAKQSALKKLADDVENFIGPLRDHPDQFNQRAAQQGVKIQTTGLFTSEAPDPLFKSEPALAEQTELLTLKDPMSDVIENADHSGFYVLHIAEFEPKRQLAFEEAKGQVTDTLRADKVRAAIEAKGRAVRDQLIAAMKGGATYDQSAAKAGVKPEKPDPFSLNSGQQTSLASLLQANPLDAGDTSPLLFDGKNGVLLTLISVDPLDPNQIADAKKNIIPKMQNSASDLLIEDWLRVERQRGGKPPV